MFSGLSVAVIVFFAPASMISSCALSTTSFTGISLTFTVTVALIPLAPVIVTVACPAFFAVTFPSELTVATVSSEDVNVTSLLSVVSAGTNEYAIFAVCFFTILIADFSGTISFKGASTVTAHVA